MEMPPCEWMVHAQYLAKFLAREEDDDNDRIFESLAQLPVEVRSMILVRFITRAMRKVPNVLMDKEELLIKCNRHHKVFDSYLSTLVGRARVYSHLDVTGEIMQSKFSGTDMCDLVLIFEANLGFRPSVAYVRKLKGIFPSHKLFKIVNV